MDQRKERIMKFLPIKYYSEEITVRRECGTNNTEKVQIYLGSEIWIGDFRCFQFSMN